MSMRVAAITVGYRSQPDLDELLRSLAHSSLRPAVTIVSDNGSPAAELDAIEAAHPDVIVLRNPRNLGYGGAVNAAVSRIDERVDWILVVNPDVVLAHDALERLVARGDSSPQIGAVGPLVRNDDGTVYPSARPLPSISTGIGHALFSAALPSNPWTRKYRPDGAEATSAHDAGWLSGSCLLVRRSAFDAIEGFDDAYFMYFEDVDLGRRLGLAGYRNVFEPTAEVIHHGAHSTRYRAVDMMRVHHRSAYHYLSTVYDAWYYWPLRLALRAGLATRAALVARALSREERRRNPPRDT